MGTRGPPSPWYRDRAEEACRLSDDPRAAGGQPWCCISIDFMRFIGDSSERGLFLHTVSHALTVLVESQAL